jgi:haloalkane dehalogenase
VTRLTARERAAYDAPFPSRKYQVGARVFPGLVPTTPDDPEHARNTQAWEFFKAWTKPCLTLFSSRDPITRGGERRFQQLVPGAQGQPHRIVRKAGHFLQEDAGPELASALDAFARAGP